METLIRLSTAHAKARLSKNVTADDAHAAIELVQFAYFKRVLEKEKKKRRRRESQSSVVEIDDEDEPTRAKRTRREKPAAGEPGHDPYEYDDDDDDSHVDDAVKRVTRSQHTVESHSSTQEQSGPSSPMDIEDSTPVTITDDRYDRH